MVDSNILSRCAPTAAHNVFQLFQSEVGTSSLADSIDAEIGHALSRHRAGLLVDRSLFETMFAAVWGFQHARVVATL